MTFTKEQIRKAMNCKTVDELLAYAKSEGIEFSREQAEEYIAQQSEHRCKLTDEELAQVVGGRKGKGCEYDPCNNYCGKDK